MKKLIIIAILLFQSFSLFAQVDEFYKNAVDAFNKGNYKKAISEFTNMIDHEPNSFRAYHNRALAYMMDRNFKKALKDFDKAIFINPNDADAYNNRGLCRQYLGEVLKSISDFDKAIQLDPKFAQAYINRAASNIQEERYVDAVKDFREAEKLDSKNPAIYFQRGLLYYNNRQYQDAINDFEKALKVGFQDEEMLYKLGNSYFHLKKYKKSIKHYTACIKMNPKHDKALNNRAVAYDKTGKSKLAKKDRDRLNELSGNKFPDVKKIKYKKIEDSFNEYSMQVPSDWFVYQRKNKETSEIVISPTKLNSIDQSYMTGIKIVFHKGMAKKFSLESNDSMLEFWKGSNVKNANSYYAYQAYSQKQFKNNGYDCMRVNARLVFTEDAIPLQMFELGMARNPDFIFGYFQSPENQFGYYEKIYKKMIKSIKVK